MAGYYETIAKGTKITPEDLESLDYNILWEVAVYYAKWLAEDPGFNRLRKVMEMIQKEIDRRYLIQDEYLRGSGNETTA